MLLLCRWCADPPAEPLVADKVVKEEFTTDDEEEEDDKGLAAADDEDDDEELLLFSVRMAISLSSQPVKSAI